MWRRFRRKTFAPRRPAVFPEQYGLVLVTAVAIDAALRQGRRRVATISLAVGLVVAAVVIQTGRA